MTPKEFRDELRKLAAEISPKADISAFISAERHGDRPIYCSVYPFGHTFNKSGEEQCYFAVQADDFPEAIAMLRAKWAEISTRSRKQHVRRMALAIIRITADLGHCTDSALRQEFSDDEVMMFGAAACEDANAIADKGPFAIVTLGGANGAPDEIPQGATVN